MDALVLGSVNNSVAEPIDATDLEACLRGGGNVDRWLPHLAALFFETPLEAIEAFVAAHAIPPEALSRTYAAAAAYVGEVNPDVEQWIRELADAVE